MSKEIYILQPKHKKYKPSNRYFNLNKKKIIIDSCHVQLICLPKSGQSYNLLNS